MSTPIQLFGRIAIKKGYLGQAQLARALRFQEEIRNLGLRKQLGEILLALESLTHEQVEVVLRLQALNLRADSARRMAVASAGSSTSSGSQRNEAALAPQSAGSSVGLGMHGLSERLQSTMFTSIKCMCDG